MGITRQQNIFRIRDGLDNPYPSNPSFHLVLKQEISEEMDIVNAAQQSGKPWAVQEYQLNYNPNQSTYTIDADDWGKVMYVVRETFNPYVQYIDVPFDDLGNLHYGVTWQGWYGTLFPFTQTPERMSFYREGVMDASIKVKIYPQPQQSFTYHIGYVPGYIGTENSLESALQLPEHAELVRLRAQTALLPYAKWHEDEAANSAKRQELAASFAYQLQRKESLFDNFIRNINLPRTVTVEDWNS